ncbi:MAG: DUF1850 domain-containing protein [Clostridiales bacterium]|nr:DUF1850 domain-containing protein [Clostridiales bacterium]
MKRVNKRFALPAVLLLICVMAVTAVFAAGHGTKGTKNIVISSQVSDTVYSRVPVKAGDELSFGWEHSFEHVTWNEYYIIREDGTFDLDRIAVGGFGAGIPAEMDCTYRYEDGLIYMENIKGSSFAEFNWIHSTTQLKWIAVNGEVFITGPDMEQRDRINLIIK